MGNPKTPLGSQACAVGWGTSLSRCLFPDQQNLLIALQGTGKPQCTACPPPPGTWSFLFYPMGPRERQLGASTDSKPPTPLLKFFSNCFPDTVFFCFSPRGLVENAERGGRGTLACNSVPRQPQGQQGGLSSRGALPQNFQRSKERVTCHIKGLEKHTLPCWHPAGQRQARALIICF